MVVSRCICCNQSFGVALAVARREGCATVAGLQEHLHIAKKCGLCIPFLQKVIETGEPAIPLMDADDTAYWSARSGLGEGEGKGKGPDA